MILWWNRIKLYLSRVNIQTWKSKNKRMNLYKEIRKITLVSNDTINSDIISLIQKISSKHLRESIQKITLRREYLAQLNSSLILF